MRKSFSENWIPVEADASTRRYYRGTWNDKKALLADFGDDSDGLERFLHVANLFKGAGLRVPEIYYRETGANRLIIQWIESPRLSGCDWSERFEDSLLDAAERISAITEWGAGPALLALDESRLRFELDFFLLHFVERFMNEDIAAGLKEATASLATRIAAFPAKLAHRDFHTDNVLLGDGNEIILLDFQDALIAPRCYDAASLAVDCYRVQRDAIAKRFREKWCSRSGAGEEEFNLTALQRVLKALGTFGYQVTVRKSVRYLSYIAPTARSALDLLPAAPPLAALRKILKNASRLG